MIDDQNAPHYQGGSNVYVFIDEAHRSVARELGTYLVAALPNATLVGFTGTPIARTAQGEATFKIFGADDEQGYKKATSGEHGEYNV